MEPAFGYGSAARGRRRRLGTGWCADGVRQWCRCHHRLQARGYLVQINWINGASKSLPLCTVVGVNNPSSAPPKPGDTVYVDVRCPNHEDDYGDVGIGVGIG
jgi:hypothetical protein